MKLSELEPCVKGGFLKFLCPCKCGGSIRVPLDEWRMTGELPNITLHPSIDARTHRVHFSIINGEIKDHP